ncbi:MAG: hypothetical protein IPH36_11370 [Saprospiraceae bacterium]|nr:hypothetical protein [Saprospiraceae bacterium]
MFVFPTVHDQCPGYIIYASKSFIIITYPFVVRGFTVDPNGTQGISIDSYLLKKMIQVCVVV